MRSMLEIYIPYTISQNKLILLHRVTWICNMEFAYIFIFMDLYFTLLFLIS